MERMCLLHNSKVQLKMVLLLRHTTHYSGFNFGHFFGDFLFTTPHINNVTDNHRYSRLLADFPSVGAGIILTVRFLEKSAFWLFGRAFWGAEGALPKSQKALFPPKQTYKKCYTAPLRHSHKIRLIPMNICDVSWHCPSVGPKLGVRK